MCDDCSVFIHKKKTEHESFFKKTKVPMSFLCPQHSFEISSFCKSCETFICVKCLGIGGNHVKHPFKVLNEAKDAIETLYNDREKSKKIIDSLKDEFSYFKEEKKEVESFIKRLIEFENEKLRELQKNIELSEEMTQSEIGNFDKAEVAVKLNLMSQETYWKYRKYSLKNMIQNFEQELSEEISCIKLTRNSNSSYSESLYDSGNWQISITCNQNFILVGFSFGLLEVLWKCIVERFQQKHIVHFGSCKNWHFTK
jgi:hypothetical protein